MADVDAILLIKAALTKGMEAAGEEIVTYIQEIGGSAGEGISKPVERDGSGEVTVRSVEGEWPRLETGELMMNIKSGVSDEGNSVILTIGSSKPSAPDVPEILDRTLNRPYMSQSILPSSNILIQRLK